MSVGKTAKETVQKETEGKEDSEKHIRAILALLIIEQPRSGSQMHQGSLP